MNYHYSTVLHLPYILLSGELQASRRDAHGDHKEGLLWFSTNEGLERTAVKLNAPLVRFGSGACCIQRWRGVAKAVGFTSGVMRRLEQSGRAMGAIPGQWMAMTGDLSLSRIETIELLTARGWQRLDQSTLHVDSVGGGAIRLYGPGGLVAMVARRRTAEGYFAYATNKETCTPDNLLVKTWREAG